MSLNTLSEIIQFAIEKEKNAQAFYRFGRRPFALSRDLHSFSRSWPMRNKNMKNFWKVLELGRWPASRKPVGRCRT